MSHDSKFAIFGNWSSTILDFLLLLLAWLLPREGGGGRQLPNCCSKTGVGRAAPFLSFFLSWQNIPHPPLITLIHPSYRVPQRFFTWFRDWQARMFRLELWPNNSATQSWNLGKPIFTSGRSYRWSMAHKLAQYCRIGFTAKWGFHPESSH